MAQKVLIEDCQLGNPGFIIMSAVGDEVAMTEQQIKNDLESNCDGKYMRSDATRYGKSYLLFYGNDGKHPACVTRQAQVKPFDGVRVSFNRNYRPFSRF